MNLYQEGFIRNLQKLVVLYIASNEKKNDRKQLFQDQDFDISLVLDSLTNMFMVSCKKPLVARGQMSIEIGLQKTLLNCGMS